MMATVSLTANLQQKGEKLVEKWNGSKLMIFLPQATSRKYF
jgi:hypothetical protein